jgi:ABC-2 type transport system permease protein
MQMLRDTALVFRRQLTLSLRNPIWVLLGLAQPVLYLVLFGPLLKSVAAVPGFPGGTAWQVFVPGLLVLLALFGAAFVGFGVIAEWRHGVLERMRVTPVSRLALLMGRVLRDIVTFAGQAVILVLIGMAFGLRAPLLGILIALGFVVLLTVCMASLSYAAAVVVKEEDALAPLINSVNMPLLLLSGTLLPMSLAPAWLDGLSRADPFRYVVEAMRDAFLGRYSTAAVWQGGCVAVVVAAFALAVGVHTFRKEIA